MRLKALKEVYYAGQTRHPGDVFECDEADVCLIWTAKDLPGGPTAEALGGDSIQPATEEVLKAHVPEPEPEKTTPEPVAETASSELEESGRRRVYRRRDLKAE